jgi:arylsulfatase A-like enzyme
MRVLRNGSARLLLGAVALALAPGCDRPPAEGPSPNILLISIDSLRADHLGAYGYDRDTSPEIDRLAREGVRWATAVAPSPWTLPSHVSLFTALPPIAHGVLFDPKALDEETLCLAEVLQANGYATAGFVGGPFLRSLYGLAQGFDVYDDRTVVRPLFESHQGRTSPALVGLATDWLEAWARRPERPPFFLFLHLWDVHYDYTPPAPFDTLFDPDYEGSITAENFELGEHIHPGMAPRDLEHVVALYDGEIRYTDGWVGRLLRFLDEQSLAADTIVVVTADHGEEFFEHGAKGHRKNLYDETMRIPLVIRYPGRVPAGRVVDALARLEDVPTTLLALAGIERPAAFGAPHVPGGGEARDLREDFDRGDAGGSRGHIAFGDLHGTQSSIRVDGMKLILTRHREAMRDELYDLAADPGEQRDLRGTRSEGRALFDRFARWHAYWEERPRHAVDIELDEEQLETLRSLGYIR